MNVNTKFNEAPKAAPVVIEQVYAEKPGGGRVVSEDYEIKQGTAVYADGTKFKAIKSARLVANAAAEDATVKVAKGSGIKANEFVGTAKKSVKVTAVDNSNEDYDVLTVSLGVQLKAGDVLYQAGSASTTATPLATPIYVVGNDVPANAGDVAVRLINGANLRKETAPIAPEVAALIPTINLV